MVTKIKNTIKQNNMLNRGERILVAFSGGADSVVLLDVLVALSEELGISVCAAHLNHMLRGKDADADAEFTRRRCEKYGIGYISECVDVAAYAKAKGESTELAARNVRYDFLRRAKVHFSADKIATAHNANDNLETILFNISRGSGIDGLCGIPPVRDDIIRPLIETTRAEIETFAKEKELSFCTDKTNAETVYSRNKLRHMALPVLSEINPMAVENAARMSRLLREDAEFLKNAAINVAKEISLSEHACKRLDMTKLSDGIFGRVCELFAKRALGKDNYTLEYKHISSIRKLASGNNPSGEIYLPDELCVRCEYEKLVFEKREESKKFSAQKLDLGENIFGEYKIFLEKTKKNGKVNNSVNTFFVLCDKISGGLFVRPRKEGDRIKLLARPGKSIKKMLIDERVPKNVRDKIPIIADEEKVLALFGFGTDESVIPENGQECFEIRIEKL